MKRDQISAKIAQARLALQMGQHEKVKLADIHIENNGSLDDFRVKIQTIYQNLKNT